MTNVNSVLTTYTVAEKAALFNELVAGGWIDLVEVSGPSFVEVLEDVIATVAAETGHTEALWVNPETGKKATTIHLAFIALAFWHTRFHLVRAAAKTLPSYHERTDLKAVLNVFARRWPSPCIDLSDVEGLVLSTSPVKGRAALDKFKAFHGITR